MTTVLLLDGRAISSLAIARRLDEMGVTVHTADTFRHSLTAHSAATTETHTYPSADETPAAFKRAVSALIERHGFDVVLPVRDATTRCLAEIAEDLPAGTETFLDSPERIEMLQDKKRFGKLAIESGIPTPETYFPEEMGIDAVRRRAEFPVLLKPTNASGARGIRRVERPSELSETYHDARRKEGDLIVQEFIDHEGGHYSIGGVFEAGTPKAIHVYEELLQYPDSGGPAIRARTVDIDPWVRELLGLLESIEWTGPAHMDVLFDPRERRYKLLEVNPRFWSSIALTIASGVDIPGVVVGLATGSDAEADPDASDTYRSGQTYRWAFPNELLWALDGWNTAARIQRLLEADGEATTYSILSREDPTAALGAVLQSVRFLLDSERRAGILERGWSDEDGEPTPELRTSR